MKKRVFAALLTVCLLLCMTVAAVHAENNDVKPGYVKEVDGYVRIWGETGAPAEESFVLEIYAGNRLMTTTQLNNVGGIINGNVNVTWNCFYPSSDDPYWTTSWEPGHPNSVEVPTRVVLYEDGVKYGENVVKMNGPDDLNPVTWADLGGVMKIEGAGTAADPYIIDSVEKLNWYNGYVEAGNEVIAQLPAAIVDGQTYDTLEKAWKAVKSGSTLVLLKDATISSALTVTQNLTIDGNGKTLTYTGSGENARAITVESTASGANLTVKNLTVNCTSSYCQRGINYNTTGNLTLDNVTVKGANVTYAVNLPGSSIGAKVTIKNSSLTGNIALNVWGKGSTINVTDTALTSVDKVSHENYVALMLNNDGNTSAEGTVVNVTGGSITATNQEGGLSNAYSNATATGRINISASTVVNGRENKPVAAVKYSNNPSQFYSCETLQNAVEKAGEKALGEAWIELVKDITLTEPVVVSKPVELKLAGHTVTGAIVLMEGAALVAEEGLDVQAGVPGCNVFYGEGKYMLVKTVVKGIDSIDESVLENMPKNLDEPKEIIDRLEAIAAEDGVEKENVQTQDIVLQVWDVEEKVWVDANEENFPKEGILIVLDLPEGTNAVDYEFIVTHMFTKAMNGHRPGEVEQPTVTIKNNKIHVVLDGLSPVSVAWKVKDSVAAVDVPQTGDESNLLFFAALLAISAAGLMVCRRKREN